MSPEKRSNTQMVRDALKDGAAFHDIGQRTGLKQEQAYRSLQYLRRRGEIPRPTKEEQYEHVSDSLKGRVRPDLSEAGTKTWKAVYPLVVRNGTVAEIAEISGISRVAVNSLINRPPRVFMDVPEYRLPEKKEERRLKTNVRKGRKKPTQDELNTLKFARELYRRDFIADEAVFWNLGKDFAQRMGKPWYKTLASGVTMEAYLIGKFLEMQGRPGVIQAYRALGEKVNSKWFNGPQMSTARVVADAQLQARFNSASPSK